MYKLDKLTPCLFLLLWLCFAPWCVATAYQNNQATPPLSHTYKANTRAKALHANGRYDEALKLLLAADSMQAGSAFDSARAYGSHLAGLCAYATKQPQLALQLLRKAYLWRSNNLLLRRNLLTNIA